MRPQRSRINLQDGNLNECPWKFDSIQNNAGTLGVTRAQWLLHSRLNYQLYEKGFTPLYSGSLQRCLRLVIDSWAKPKRNVETNNYFPMSQIFLLRLSSCSKSHLVQNPTLFKIPPCSKSHLAQNPILLSLFLFPLRLLSLFMFPLRLLSISLLILRLAQSPNLLKLLSCCRSSCSPSACWKCPCRSSHLLPVCLFPLPLAVCLLADTPLAQGGGADFYHLSPWLHNLCKHRQDEKMTRC